MHDLDCWMDEIRYGTERLLLIQANSEQKPLIQSIVKYDNSLVMQIEAWGPGIKLVIPADRSFLCCHRLGIV
jgi:hypothetical protein